MTDRVTCPDCNGSGTTMAFFVKYAPGTSTGPMHRELPCMFCRGKKTVTSNQMEWKTEGRKIREHRIKSGFTLREAAKRFGLKPSDISNLESGRVFNLNWKAKFNHD
jgi:DNA-binding XRE family transcriptional regulator